MGTMTLRAGTDFFYCTDKKFLSNWPITSSGNWGGLFFMKLLLFDEAKGDFLFCRGGIRLCTFVGNDRFAHFRFGATINCGGQ